MPINILAFVQALTRVSIETVAVLETMRRLPRGESLDKLTT
jgi:hypothetical protein